MTPRLFRFPSRAPQPAERLYLALVEQARRPEFYDRLSVPDTLDGRFDMIVLHAVLLIARLRATGGGGARLAQGVFDAMFADMDHNLREIGVGDLSVGRRVKAMAMGFYGRAAAYEAALAGGGGALEAALARNVYGTLETQPEPAALAALAEYMRRQAAALDRQPAADLLDGRIDFEPPSALVAGGAGD